MPEIRGAGERLVRREFTAVLGDRPNIYAGAHRIVDDRCERVLVQIEVELPPLPEGRLGSLQLFHFFPRRFERRQQKPVALRDWFLTESRIGRFQSGKHHVHVGGRECRGCLGRKHRLAIGFAQVTQLPDLLECSLRRVGTQACIPPAQERQRTPSSLVVGRERDKKDHETARRDRQDVILQALRVLERNLGQRAEDLVDALVAGRIRPLEAKLAFARRVVGRNVVGVRGCDKALRRIVG